MALFLKGGAELRLQALGENGAAVVKAAGLIRKCLDAGAKPFCGNGDSAATHSTLRGIGTSEDITGILRSSMSAASPNMGTL